MNIDFNSRNFENPSVQKVLSGIHALAMKKKEAEYVEDLLEPDYEGLKKFDHVLAHFRNTFYNGAVEDPECGQKLDRSNARV